MKPECGFCIHYCQTSELYTTAVLNVSDQLAKWRKWSKHRCALKQEDKYPRSCDFELNQELLDELNRRYPDLAAISARTEGVRRKLDELINC